MGSSLGSEAASINTQSRLLSARLWSLEGQEAVYREQAPVATWGVTGMDTEHFLQRGQTAGVPPLGTVALWTFRRQNKELCNLPLSKVTASTNTAPATPLLPLWFPLLCFVCFWGQNPEPSTTKAKLSYIRSFHFYTVDLNPTNSGTTRMRAWLHARTCVYASVLISLKMLLNPHTL